MSAVTALPRWAPAVAPTSPAGPRTGSPRRRHLHAVPTPLTSEPDVRVRGRITRRGRLVLTILVTSALLTVGVAGARATIGGTAQAYDTITIEPGQTLSQVAHGAYPGLAVSDAVQRVQAANNLNTVLVFGGEQLRLPR